MIFHSLTFARSRENCSKPREQRMVMNDKIMFYRYYCINSTRTKEIMVHYNIFIRIKVFFLILFPGGLQFLIISTCFAWRSVKSMLNKSHVLTTRANVHCHLNTWLSFH